MSKHVLGSVWVCVYLLIEDVLGLESPHMSTNNPFHVPDLPDVLYVIAILL